MLGRARVSLDPRDMKAAYVVSDENGYYDSQNIVCVRQAQLPTPFLVDPQLFWRVSFLLLIRKYVIETRFV